MKNLLPLLIFTLVFAACKQSDSDNTTRNIQLLTDSTAYSNNNIYTDSMASANASGVKTNPSQEEVVKPIVKKKSNHEQPVKVVYVKTAPEKTTEATTPPITATPPIVKTNDSTSNETVSTGNKVPDAGVPGEVKKNEKKGWSKAAQGAVIGGAAGAVGGAILSKKKGVGAVIGGIVGAAGGYILGKNKDKKEAAKNESDDN